MLVNKEPAPDLAKLMMIVPPVHDAKADCVFWVVILKMTAPITSFATANFVSLAVQATINVLTELFAETTCAKLVAKITVIASQEPSVLTASVTLVVLRLLTVLSQDNNATMVSATFSDARQTLIV